MEIAVNPEGDKMSLDNRYPQSSFETLSCAFCCEEIQGEPVRPCKSCMCFSCGDCVRQIFLVACKDESQMPPRCCVPIPLAAARRYLSAEEVNLYKEKYEEWSTPNRIYCPVPTCSAFLPHRIFQAEWSRIRTSSTFMMHVEDTGPGPSAVPLNQMGAIYPIQCPKCTAQICSHCKQLYHYGVHCQPPSDIDPVLARTFENLGIKRCPKCRAAVRRMYGCRHMQCRCGAQWCWYCGRAMEICKKNICQKGRENEIDFTDVEDADSDEEGDNEDGDGDNNNSPYFDGTYYWYRGPYEYELYPDSEKETNEEEEEPQPDDEEEELQSDEEEEEPQSDNASTLVRHGGQARQVSFPGDAGDNEDLDSGSQWEEGSEFFGNEPDESRVDPFDCPHDFSAVLANSEVENLEYECEKCWRRIFPRETLIPASLWAEIESHDTSPVAQLVASMNVVERSDALMYVCKNCKLMLCHPCRALYPNFEF